MIKTKLNPSKISLWLLFIGSITLGLNLMGFLTKIYPISFPVFIYFVTRFCVEFYESTNRDSVLSRAKDFFITTLIAIGTFYITVPLGYKFFSIIIPWIGGSPDPKVIFNVSIYAPLVLIYLLIKGILKQEISETPDRNEVRDQSNEEEGSLEIIKSSSDNKVLEQVGPEEKPSDIDTIINKDDKNTTELVYELSDYLKKALLSLEDDVKKELIILNAAYSYWIIVMINRVDIEPKKDITIIFYNTYKDLFDIDLTEYFDTSLSGELEKNNDEVFEQFCYSVDCIIKSNEQISDVNLAEFSKLLNYTFCLYLEKQYDFSYIEPLTQLATLYVGKFDKKHLSSTFDYNIRIFRITSKIPLRNYKQAISSINGEDSKTLLSIHLQFLKNQNNKIYKIILEDLILECEALYDGNLLVELERCESINEYIELFNNINAKEPENSKIDPEMSVDISGIEELDRMIGLSSIKTNIKETIAYIKVSSVRDSKQCLNLNCCFFGAPGTGKTVVARIYGKILKEIGALESGHLIETDRSGLVGGYVGQTAIKTKEMCEKALNGVLFVDEAYTLFRSDKSEDSFGLEAIDTILKFMEDNKGKIAVIFAGYENEMNTFLSSNPGLKSRISNFFNFPNYSKDELRQITKLFLDDHKVKYDEDVIDKIVDRSYADNHLPDYANARTLRNVIEKTLRKQSLRVFDLLESSTGKDNEEIHRIRLDDIS